MELGDVRTRQLPRRRTMSENLKCDASVSAWPRSKENSGTTWGRHLEQHDREETKKDIYCGKESKAGFGVVEAEREHD